MYGPGRIDIVVREERLGFDEDEVEVAVTALACGSCSGPLRWKELSPQGFFTCRYCEAVVECRHVKPGRAVFTPDAPTEPYLAVGAKGRIRGRDVEVTGFVMFTSEDRDGTSHHFEYMLGAGPRAQCTRLLELGDAWYLVTPLRPEDVQFEDGRGWLVTYDGASYEMSGASKAVLERSVQVSDPCVEERRSSNAEYFKRGQNCVRIENRGLYKVYYSFCEGLSSREVADGFGLASLPPSNRARVKAKPPSVVARIDAFLEAIGPVIMAGLAVFGILAALSMIRC